MSEEIFGNLHSIESCGTVDGPGIRFVVFTQGCPMRCQYCHNPDTWDFKDNHKVSVDEIVKQYEGVKEFCAGGVTVTGGEPMAQIEFVTELFKKLSEKGVYPGRYLLFERQDHSIDIPDNQWCCGTILPRCH